MERRTFLKGLVAIPFVPIPRLLRGLESLAPVEPANAYSCIVPHGTILPFAGNLVPPGWLPCDGRAIPTAMYPKLHDAIGKAYGGGRFSMRVPDMRGKLYAEWSEGRRPPYTRFNWVIRA